MIRQVERYHGAVLARLVRRHLSESISIRVHGSGRSGYVLDDRVGLYVKYSTNRLTPWLFSFSSEHQGEIANLKSECTTFFIALVCGEDGIACLNRFEYLRLLDDENPSVGWIRASRRSREKYLLTGSDAKQELRVGDNEFPSKVSDALSMPDFEFREPHK